MPLPTLTEDQQKEFDTLVSQKASEEAQKLLEEQIAQQALDEKGRELLKKRDGLLRESQAKVKELESALKDKDITAKEKADLEQQLKTYQEAEAKAKEAAKTKADEEKSAKELVAQLEETFKRELTAREEKALKQQNEFLDELKARDAQILMQAVIAEAKDHGIIDESIVKLLDVSGVKIERGIPDREAIAELIDEHAKSKPHLYKDSEETERQRDERGRFSSESRETKRPASQSKTTQVDWAKLSPQEFDEKEAELRAARA